MTRTAHHIVPWTCTDCGVTGTTSAYETGMIWRECTECRHGAEVREALREPPVYTVCLGAEDPLKRLSPRSLIWYVTLYARNADEAVVRARRRVSAIQPALNLDTLHIVHCVRSEP